MRDVTLVAGTVIVALGLVLIMWRELAGATDRRKTGQVRDTVEVLLPVVAMVSLLWWVWVS